MSHRSSSRLRLERLEARLTPAFATFRVGDGHSVTQESVISAAAPTLPVPGPAILDSADATAPGSAKQSLFKFDNLFGSGPGRIPANATITNASISLWAVGGDLPSTDIDIRRMYKAWTPETATWDYFDNGIQAIPGEASIDAEATVSVGPGGFQIASQLLVTSLQAWAVGAPNFGFVVSTRSPGARWSFAGSADPIGEHRPMLTVEYSVPGVSNPSYVDIAGAPPSPLKSAWFTWADYVEATRLARVPNQRANTYYFAQNGSDATGLGTIDYPWRTLSKAQAVLQSGAGNTRLRFRRGDVWQEPTTLTVNQNGVTVDDYGDPALDKPRFSRFSPIAPEVWQQVTGNTYKYVGAEHIGWVRFAADGYSNIFYRAASSAEVIARSLSWYFDEAGTEPGSNNQPTLYVNSLANPADPINRLEACPDDGIGWTVDGDNVRLQNLKLEGQGISASGQGYGLKIVQRGQYMEFVGQGLDVFYTGYHAVGQILQYHGSHGVATLVDVRAGFCVNRNGTGGAASGDITVFVAYGDWGGNEFIANRNTIAYGALPSADWLAVPGLAHGQGLYTHVGQGGSLDLVLVRGTKYDSMLNPVAILNQIDSMVPAVTLDAVRAFIVEDQTGTIQSWWHKPSLAVINCVIDQRSPPPPYDQKLAAFYYGPFYVGGWIINCSVTIDARNQFNVRYQYIFGGITSIHYINSHIDIFNCPVDLFFREPYSNPYIQAGNSTMVNTIVSLDTTASTALDLVNDSAHLKNNAYYMPRPWDGAQYGFSNDAGAVTLNRRYAFGVVPSPSSLLHNGGVDIGLEYDQLRRPRGKLKTIGPNTGASLPAPTLVQFGWGIRKAPLVAGGTIPVSTANRISMTFPTAVDVGIDALKVWDANSLFPFTSFTYNSTSRTAEWRMSTAIPKGRYQLELDGQPMFTFTVLPGDFDGSGTVGNADWAAFRLALGTNSITYDLDGDGDVDNCDFLSFAGYFGTSL